MGSIISCKNISKTFDKTRALDGVSLEFEKDKIYGLLGLNGAGKTTLIRLICGRLFPTTGCIYLDGQCLNDNEHILERICYVSESSSYPKDFTVKEIAGTGEAFYPNWDKELALTLLDKFKLDKDKKIKALSKGMQSSLSIVVGICSRAQVTIFDEAYLGLDASMRQMFYDSLLDDYGRFPRTVIFSSHLIDECSSLFEEAVILHNGRVLLHNRVDTLIEKSFYVAGNKDVLDKYIRNKNTIHSEEMGRLASYSVFDSINEDEMKAMGKDGIEIQPMPLQKLFICFTSMNGGMSYGQNENAV